jgi:hypothetical protein
LAPAEPEALADAIMSHERAKRRSTTVSPSPSSAALGDLLLGGIEILWTVLKK